MSKSQKHNVDWRKSDQRNVVTYNYRIQNIGCFWRLSDIEYKRAWEHSGGDEHVPYFVLDSSDMVIYIYALTELHTIYKLYLKNKD